MILVNAKEAGIANLFVWDDQNNIASFNVESTLNIDKLRDVLRISIRIEPGHLFL